MIFVLSASSCSVLFEPIAEQKALDAGVSDAALLPDAGRADGGLALCAESTPLDGGGQRLRLEHGAALDLDDDGLDELLLFGRSDTEERSVYIHRGDCGVPVIWDYQQVWHPRRPGLAPEIGGLGLHVVSLAEGPAQALVAVGESQTESYLAAFAHDGLQVDDEAFFVEGVPSTAGSCANGEAPLSLTVGNFANDGSDNRDDIIFSSNLQTYQYDVPSWDAPPAWDLSCSMGIQSGTTPTQVSEVVERYGQVPLRGSTQDEFLDLRGDSVEWRFPGGSLLGGWSDGKIRSAAFNGDAVADDGQPDALAWGIGSPLRTYSVQMRKAGGRSLAISSFTVDLNSQLPTTGTIVDHDSTRLLLFLLPGQMVLVAPPFESSPSISRVDIGFEAEFVVTPNWGPGASQQIYVFEPDSAAYGCYQISDSLSLEPC